MAVVIVLVALMPMAAGGGTSSAGSSFIPHSGQCPGSSLTTSGCIGQA